MFGMTKGLYRSNSISSSLLGEEGGEDDSEFDGEGDRERIRPMSDLLNGGIHWLLSSSGATK